MSEDTKPNIKYKIGQTFGTPLAWLLCSAAAAGLNFAVIPNVMDSDIAAPDRTGTAMEQSVLEQHQNAFDALKQMKAEIELNEAKAAASGSSAAVDELKTAFGDKALNSYMDLYLSGASQTEGAAISEEAFETLRAAFAKEIVSPSTLGFSENIAAGMLDETLAETRLNQGTELDKFQTVKALDGKLTELHDQQSAPLAAAGLASLGTLLLFFVLCGPAMAARWRYSEPERVPVKKPQKKYGQH
ncbi:MAG: hypothetical protein HND56_09500 [Pseudomonadota bacterium]|nr:hypothetical protein [Pseudomonadota bacterium]QKK05906.1 MAG: hypothetical protein HND56_09500 [Pseudomonadota bacterium]